MRADGSRQRRPDLLDIIGRWAAAAPLFLFRSHFRVRGSSMTPSLRDGDLVHVLPRRCATPRLGSRRGRRGCCAPTASTDSWSSEWLACPVSISASAPMA